MMTEDQKLALEACRQWAEKVGIADDDWRSLTSFVAGYVTGRAAMEQELMTWLGESSSSDDSRKEATDPATGRRAHAGDERRRREWVRAAERWRDRFHEQLRALEGRDDD